jgi:hydroxyacylglutathione hydrolase
MFKIAKFTFNPLAENTYILHQNGHAVVIDPGMYHQHEEEAFDEFLFKNSLVLDKIVNTHCHLDHVAGVSYLQNKYKVPFFIPKGEVEVLKAAELSAQYFGLNLFQKVDDYQVIEDENEIDFCGEKFQIFSVPGHSPDHFAYYSASEGVILSGDVLFQGSIGRYDLPGGDLEILKNSIFKHLFTLPDATKVLSGHGATTTIGQEKNNNIIHQL